MSETRYATLHLRVLGETHKVSLAVPPTPAAMADLLPAARSITNATMAVALDKTAAAGAPASCRQGCDACCHQFVGISAPEARAIAQLVDALPADRQVLIRQRFAHTLTVMRESGLLTPDSPDGAPVFQIHDRTKTGRDRHMDVARRYFRLHQPCPFLEGGSCTIYEDRPLICREYAVTTPPELCAHLDTPPRPPEMVEPPVRLSGGLAELTALVEEKTVRQIPLIAALAWATLPENAAPSPNASGVDLLKLLAQWTDSQSNIPLDQRPPTNY
jgi:Fe-S-cluster containining protein